MRIHTNYKTDGVSECMMKSLRNALCALVLAASISCSSQDSYPGGIEQRVLTDNHTVAIIHSGGAYSGDWSSNDPDIPAVDIRTSEQVRIQNSSIQTAGSAAIFSSWKYYADVIVDNVTVAGLDDLTKGVSPGRFIHLDRFLRAHIVNSSASNTAGMYFHDADAATIQITNNMLYDINGGVSDGNGGLMSVLKVQGIQFDQLTELTNSEISFNEFHNTPGLTNVEDVINIHNSSASADDPLRIYMNWISHASTVFAVDYDSTFTGGGILISDGADGSHHIHASHNTIVGTVNYALGIASGSHNKLFDNTAVSCGKISVDGLEKVLPSQNVGIYIYNHYNSSNFQNNSGFGNSVAWVRADQKRNDVFVVEAERWEDNISLFDNQEVPCDYTQMYQTYSEKKNTLLFE